jgi:hypothetical protein
LEEVVSGGCDDLFHWGCLWTLVFSGVDGGVIIFLFFEKLIFPTMSETAEFGQKTLYVVSLFLVWW